MKDKIVEEIKKHRASYVWEHDDYAGFEGWLAGFLLALNMTGAITAEEHIALLDKHSPYRQAEKFGWCSNYVE